MKRQPVASDRAAGAAAPTSASRLLEGGIQAARAVRVVRERSHIRTIGQRPASLKRAIAESARGSRESQRWYTDNYRLIRTALAEITDLARSLREFPQVSGPRGEHPRVYVLAQDYFAAAQDRFGEEEFVRFVEGYQRVVELHMGEIWALKPALQLVLLERLAAAEPALW
ncbi:MAG TPA: hypothetical protein VHA11_04665, partial [Bryobacteraceae bacterium]|nr:hypothetical protein [Bryobacteraceae bacterium]